MSTTISAQYNALEKLEESKEDYFRCHCYFPILDCIIESVNRWFMSESLEMTTSIDNFFELEFELSTYFIDHYTVHSEKSVERNI